MWEDAMKYFACITFATATFAFALSANAASRHIILAQASPPEVCTQVYQPVCGTDPNGKRTTYSNACFARVAKATNVTPGECPK
jgi:Kazal-type serine protease inhibitor domain